MNKIPLIVICGPTGAGKTDIAIELAEKYNGEIVSADSRQIYIEPEIGANKPSKEQLKRIRHYMINIISIKQDYSAFDFMKNAREYIKKIYNKGKIPFLVGGTGLYIRATLYGLSPAPGRNPEIREKLKQRAKEIGLNKLYEELKNVDKQYAEKINPNDRIRIIRALEVYYTTGKPLSYFFETQKQENLFKTLIIGITPERKVLYEFINRRVIKMFESGLVEEVKKLLKSGIDEDILRKKIIGYGEVIDYLNKEITLEEAIRKMQKKTRVYARRQIIWFKKEKGIEWFDPLKERGKIIEKVEEFKKITYTLDSNF